MIIYGSSMSPFVRKAAAFANEKGVAFELKPVTFADANPAFRAISPFAKMPAMDDDGFGLADSSAICHYLEARHPEPALIPVAAEDRGRTIWFEEFADTILAGCIATIFFNRVVAPRFLKREGDEGAAVKAATESLPPLLDYLDGQVGDRRFLVGEGLTLADIAVASPLANLAHCGVEVDASAHPNVARYCDVILSRPSFAGMIARERAFFART